MDTESVKLLVEILMETRDQVEYLKSKLNALEDYVMEPDQVFQLELGPEEEMNPEDFSGWLSNILGDK